MTDKLDTEIFKALQMLDKLTEHKPPLQPLGLLNPKMLAESRGVFFFHTTKVGLGIGVKWGTGILLAKQSGGGKGWSNPILFQVKEGSVGFTAGFGLAETLLVLGKSSALDKFTKSSKVVVGSDFKVVAISDLGLGAGENSGNLNSTNDAHAITLADGVIADLSLVGGTLSYDQSANREIYGPEATVESLLGEKVESSTDSGGAPPALTDSITRLHDALNEVMAAAEADPRDFTGFRKKWKPQPVFSDQHKMHQGVDAHAQVN